MALRLVESEYFARQVPVSLQGSNVAAIESVVVNTYERAWIFHLDADYQLLKIDSEICSNRFLYASSQGNVAISWEPPTGITDTAETLEGLRSVVSLIQQGRALPPASPEFGELIVRAATSRGTPADIETWADRISRDVGDLTD